MTICPSLASRRTDSHKSNRQHGTHLPLQLRVSFIVSVIDPCRRNPPLFGPSPGTLRKGRKEAREGKPGCESLCASSGKANSHHGDYGRFTLQSLKPKLAAPLIAMDIYQAHLSTQNNTKLVCLFMFSCHAIGCKHLLIQLWISRVTAEGALATVCVPLSAFQLEAHQSPCSLHLSRSSQGCAPSVTRRTVTRQQRARRMHGIRSRNCTHKQRGERAVAPTSAASAKSHPHESSYILVTAT